MVRIIRDGVTYGPDELDNITGEPLEHAEVLPQDELTEAEVAALELEELGATKSGTWWALEIDGETLKANGAIAALAKFQAADAGA